MWRSASRSPRSRWGVSKVTNVFPANIDAEILHRVKVSLVRCLELEQLPEELDDDLLLFADADKRSLDLDSLAALEIIVALSNEFDIVLAQADPEAFQSIRTLAMFVQEQRKSVPPTAS
jgi:acyl carrier protein